MVIYNLKKPLVITIMSLDKYNNVNPHPSTLYRMLISKAETCDPGIFDSVNPDGPLKAFLITGYASQKA